MGLSFRRRARVRRSALRRAAGAACVAALIAVGSSVGPGATPGFAAQARGYAAVAPGEAADSPAFSTELELVVVADEPVLAESANSFGFTVALRNTSDTAVPAGEMVLELSPERVLTADDLSNFAEAASFVIGRTPAAEVPADSSVSVHIDVPREDFGLAATSAEGVYLVRASPHEAPPAENSSDDLSVPDAPAHVAALTPVVWRGVGEATLAVSVIVPLVLPDSVDSIPTPAELGEAAPKLDALLTAATQVQATLAIDPRVFASIRAYGDASPKAATAFLRRLESSTLPNFVLQFADADPAAQAAIGSSSLLEAPNLDFVSSIGDHGDATPPPDTEESPTPTEEPPIPVASPTAAPANPTGPPSQQQLLAWSPTLAAAWPAEGEANAATLALITDAGLDTVVLDDTNVTLTGGPRATVGDASALITDSALSRSVTQRITTDDETAQRSAMADAIAHLALTADQTTADQTTPQSTTPSLVLALDRSTISAGADPAAAFEQLEELPFVSFVPQSELAVGEATLRASDTLDERRELLRSAASREASIAALGPLIAEPQYLAGYQRSRLLALFATRFGGSEQADSFAAIAKAYREQDASLLENVTAISSGKAQLLGTSAQLPVQLRNTLPFDAFVTVHADPASAALQVETPTFTKVKVPALGDAQLLVPVKSRVASGDTGLVLTITDGSGDLTAYTGTLMISVSSNVEFIALGILGAGALLFFVFGIARSARRRRSRAALRLGEKS